MASEFTHNGIQGKVAMMKSGSIIIEIYQTPEAELTEIRNRKNGHIDHVAFDVDNIEAVFKLLTQDGFKVFETAPVFLPFWKNSCNYFNI